MPKRVELISELVPHAGVIALLVNPKNPQTEPSIRGVQEATGTKGLRLQILRAGKVLLPRTPAFCIGINDLLPVPAGSGRTAYAHPKHPEIRVNSLKFYVCATVL